VAAAQIEFGQDQAVLFVQPGHEADHAPYGGHIGLDAGDLGAQVAVQAGQFEPRLVQDPGDGVLGVAVVDGQAELLVLGAGADLLVAAGADAGHDPDHHLLMAVGPDRRGQPGDLRRAVDDDTAHPEAQGGAQIARGGCLYVFRQGTSVGFGVVQGCWGYAASSTSFGVRGS
jgi:hypothetical protein